MVSIYAQLPKGNYQVVYGDDAWHRVKKGHTAVSGDTNVPVECSGFIVLPLGLATGTPTCPDCVKGTKAPFKDFCEGCGMKTVLRAGSYCTSGCRLRSQHAKEDRFRSKPS